MAFHKVLLWCPPVDKEFKNMEKIKNQNTPTSKWFQLVKSTSKTKLNHLLLSITFYDKYCKSQLNSLHLSTQHNNKGHCAKKSNLSNDYF